MINDATIKMVKYPPELIPDSWVGTVPLATEVATPVLDLKNFSPYLISLNNIQLVANASVQLRALYDSKGVQETTAAMLSAFPGAWSLAARNSLRLNFYGLAGAPVTPYTTHYGVWVKKATIADKLRWGIIPLTTAEQALVDKLGIADTVQKGLLPLPISQQIEREYDVIAEETHSRPITIVIPNVVYPVEKIYPKNPDEFIVLTRIASSPDISTDTTRIIIGRDNDSGIADINTFALSLLPGGEISCFIPAMKEIRIDTQSAVAPVAPFIPMLYRYTFQRIRLTSILKTRFELIRRDDLATEKLKDAFDRTIAGIN